MIIYRQLEAYDILRLDSANDDSFTETFPISFYLNYQATTPSICEVALLPSTGDIISYMIAGATYRSDNHIYFSHICAISVDIRYRKRGIATNLMKRIKNNSISLDCDIIDLFVRPTNVDAIKLYKRLEYFVYNRIPRYYSDEDAYDMRQALKKNKKCTKPAPTPNRNYSVFFHPETITFSTYING